MWILYLISISFITFFSFSIASFAFICEKDRANATKLKSGIYEKGAKHLANFAQFFSIFLGVSFIFDYFMQGYLMRNFIVPNQFELLFLILSGLFILSGLIFCISHSMNKVFRNIFFKLNVLIGLAELILLIFFTWIYFRNSILAPDWTFLSLWQAEQFKPDFYIYILCSLFMALFGSHIYALFYLILRRNRDNYGRDYYNTMLKSHAKRAFFSGFLMLLSFVALLYFLPLNLENFNFLMIEMQKIGINLSLNLELGISELMEYYALIPLVIILFGLLFLQRIAVATLPLQKKSMFLLAFIFIHLGILPFFFQLINRAV